MASVELLFSVAQQLSRTLFPLSDGLSTEQTFAAYLRTFGWVVDPGAFQIADVRAAVPIASELATVTQVFTEISASQDYIAPQRYLDLVDAFKSTLDVLFNTAGSAAPPGIPAGAWTTFTTEVVDQLIVTDMEQRRPLLTALLIMAGIVVEQAVGSGGDPQRTPYTHRQIVWDGLTTLVSNPTELARQIFGWAGASGSFQSDLLLERFGQSFPLMGLPVQTSTPPPALLDLYYSAASPFRSQARQFTVTLLQTADNNGSLAMSLGFMAIPESGDLSGPPQGFVLQPTLTITGTPPASALWPYGINLTASGGQAKYDAARVEILPSGFAVRLTSPTEITVDATAQLQYSTTNPRALVGSMFSHRFTLNTITFELSMNGPVGDAEIILGVDLPDARIVVDTTDADQFAGPQLGSDGSLVVTTPMGLDWSSKTGFHFKGGAGIEVQIPLNATFGPVTVSGVQLQAQVGGGAVAVGAGVSAGFKLGPVAASVQGVGVKTSLTQVPPGQPAGVLGRLEFQVGFQPPTGVGLAIDAGSVHGGGFISFDPVAGRYSGALQLSVYDIAVNAFGLIETKVPGVSYSFVIIISAQFTPIQLGFGFTLNGVGGMIGINRAIDTAALGNLVRAGQSEELLFPKNVVADAPTIVRDLTTVFPATQSHTIFGPLGKLGWGTPTLITGEIGVILQYPGPVVVILGEVKCILPKPDAALVKLNLSVDGELDFPNKMFAMDAALHDSVINGFPVSGQMAMRVNWGDKPNFIFSIGGFHPAYTPPPDFPKLQPMTLDLGSHGPAKISVSGFFAVTSNTVQVGGTAALHASGSGITLDASVSVKALFVFQPFSFEADIDASVKISFHGYGPSVHLSGVLDGPSPWHLKGEVCVSIIWWDACLGFDVTFGGDQQVTQPSIDPWLGAPSSDPTTTIIGLQKALSDPGNWSAALVPGTASSVARAQGTDTLIDPVGGLTVRQKTAPVETPNPLTRFGVAKTPQPISFSGVQATLGTAGNTVPLTAVQPVNEFFAPAQFFDMDDGKKLSSSGFEPHQAGYVFATAANKANVQGGSAFTFTPQLVTLQINPDGSDTPIGSYTPSDDQVTAANQRSAVAKGGLTQAGTRRFVDRALAQAFSEVVPTFVIGSSATLLQVAQTPAAAVRSATLIALDAFRAQNPELAAGLQVTALHELNHG